VNTTINNSIIIDVQNNDTDPENGILSTLIDHNNLPSNGEITLDGNDIIYTPFINFSGIDQFNYIVCDDDTPILCDTAIV